MSFTPDTAEVILISFEGPDRYSLAGGLGTRMAELARALAEGGTRTHLAFVGDPDLPAKEDQLEGRLTLHRWSQWISRYHPQGVYDGEDGKIRDLAHSLPPFLAEEVIRPTAAAGRVVLVMLEEWHTAPCAIALSDHLHAAGLRDRSVLLWNANNTMGFEKVDWPRLNFTTTITTVSRFMKQLMWGRGVDAIVIPNGIPRRWLDPVHAEGAATLRHIFTGRRLLAKVARFDPDKRWHMAVAAVAELKRRGARPVLVMKGGIEPHGGEVLAHAAALGLAIRDVTAAGRSREAAIAGLAGAADADILNVKFFLQEDLLRCLYQAADAVLANSGREPFGLVGLEVMACGGVAITGATGEEYLRPFENGISCESSDPLELATYVELLAHQPALAAQLRAEGRATAERFTWDHVIEGLRYRLDYVAQRQGVTLPDWPQSPPMPEPGGRRSPKVRSSTVRANPALNSPSTSPRKKGSAAR
jgi:glycosyltransferase involved in cell wall biosynthesis